MSSLLIDCGAAAALLCTLFGVFVLDRNEPLAELPAPISSAPDPEPEPEPPPPPQIVPPKESLPPVDPTPRVALEFQGGGRRPGRFGLRTTSGNPDDVADDNKRLTFSTDGASNNTRLSVDGSTPLLDDVRLTSENRSASDGSFAAAWKYEDVEVAQAVELIAGDVSRRIDAIGVSYTLKNTGGRDHRVGLRVMLDTYIGDNDGVPFIVAGSQGLLTEPRTYRGAEVPDFVRALERADLANPGAIVDIGLRGSQWEPPTRVVLSHWPGSGAGWEYAVSEFRTDSAAGLYFDPRVLPPGGTRTVGFTYGLGTISSTRTRNANLSLTAGGPFLAGGKFWLAALIQNPREGQKVQLELPEGLTLANGEPATKAVAPNGAAFTQISWLVQIGKASAGEMAIKARLEPDGAEERQVLNIQPPAARLSVVARGAVVGGKPSWVSALVRNPKPGQTVELTLPSGITFAPGHAAAKAVPTENDYAQVSWLIRPEARTKGNVVFRVKLLPEALEDDCTVDVEPGTLIR